MTTTKKGRGKWYGNSFDSDSYNSIITIGGEGGDGDGKKKRIQILIQLNKEMNNKKKTTATEW